MKSEVKDIMKCEGCEYYEINNCPDCVQVLKESNLPANVLIFDTSKRRKPLKNRVYETPCEVINLAEYRAKRAARKAG